MSWKNILKAEKTMAELSDSDRQRIEAEKERYERTTEGEDLPSFEETVNKLLSKGNSVSKVIDKLDAEYNEWFSSSGGEEWALKNGYTPNEYYNELDELRGDDDDDDDNSMEDMERRSERSANTYFSGGGYNTGD